MTIFYKRICLVFNLAIMFSSCYGQSDKTTGDKIDREPAVAGSFYSSNKAELENTLAVFFDKTEKSTAESPLAVVVPHAGYVFSGEVAAASFHQIDRNRKFDHVFIIGSSHTAYFDGASVYARGDFLTPLGKVTVDPLSKELVARYDFISGNTQPHEREHSLEVQLPFLQYWLKEPFQIVPIIIGGDNRKTCDQLAQALKPYFSTDNLFVISTDFSHYPDYSNALRSDNAMAEAILSNSSDNFLKTKRNMESSNIPNLATAMCGWTSVLTLLNITEEKSNLTYKKILYKNSGDSDYGEKDRVVGYYAICVTGNDKNPMGGHFDLNREDKIQLLSIARKSLDNYVRTGIQPEIKEGSITPGNRDLMGAFVTLYTEKGELRGCIGNIESEKPLYKTVQSLVIASATRDFRFKPISADELNEIDIEISVLSPMQKINSIDEIELGRHGIYLRKGFQTGTFLPQVATETQWSKEEFLGRCARDKANIGWDGWKDAEIYIYEALKFSEKDYRDPQL